MVAGSAVCRVVVEVDAGSKTVFRPCRACHCAASFGADLVLRAAHAASSAVQSVVLEVDANALAGLQVRIANDRAGTVSAFRKTTHRVCTGVITAAAMLHVRARVDASTIARGASRVTLDAALAIADSPPVLGNGAAEAAATAMVGVAREVDAGLDAVFGSAGAALDALAARARLTRRHGWPHPPQ